MFQLDSSDPTPLYAQLERAIRVAIATGRLQQGERLPTVRQLAVELRINANTVAKVYGELERAGVLGTYRGVGTFVRGVESQVASLPERRRELARLADRFLSAVAALGFRAEDAIKVLNSRGIDSKEETFDA
jgi:GntR family transcriptional regulator